MTKRSDEARGKILSKLPVETDVRSVQTLPQKTESVGISAFTEEEASAEGVARAQQQFGSGSQISDLDLVERGSKGLFGIGKRPNCYSATLSAPQMFKVTFRRTSELLVTFAPVAKVVRSAIAELTEGCASWEKYEAVVEKLAAIGVEALPDLLQSRRRGGDGQAWVVKAIGRIGDPDTVDLLLDALANEEQGVRREAAEALGTIGSEHAEDGLEVVAGSDPYADVRDAAKRALLSIRLRRRWDPKTIVQALQHIETRPAALRVLVEIGDKRAVGAVLDILFAPPSEELNLGEIEFSGLLGEYAGLVMASAYGYRSDTETTGREWEEVTNYSYDLAPMLDAVEQLSEMVTPVTSNILHKLTGLEDPQVPHEYNERAGGTFYETISLDEIRRQARDALDARGNPPYDAAHFECEESW